MNKSILADDYVEKLGSDLKFPIVNIFEPISGTDLLMQDIQLLLLTSPGERVMNPTYGCGLKNLVWENMDEAFRTGTSIIRSAITNFEPRVTVMNVTGNINRNTGLITYNIQFLIKATGDTANLVFPLRLANQLAFG